MTEVLTGVEELRYRVEHALPLYYHGQLVTPEEAGRILRHIPTKPAERISRPESATLTLLPNDVVAARTLECLRCDMLRSTTDRCGAIGCGCSISQRRKHSWGSCPMEKWPRLYTPSLPVEPSGI